MFQKGVSRHTPFLNVGYELQLQYLQYYLHIVVLYRDIPFEVGVVDGKDKGIFNRLRLQDVVFLTPCKVL